MIPRPIRPPIWDKYQLHCLKRGETSRSMITKPVTWTGILRGGFEWNSRYPLQWRLHWDSHQTCQAKTSRPQGLSCSSERPYQSGGSEWP